VAQLYRTHHTLVRSCFQNPLPYYTIIMLSVAMNVRLMDQTIHHYHRQKNLHWVMTLLRKFWQICPILGLRPSCFYFLGFRNNNFFKEQGRQPCVQSAIWRNRTLYLLYVPQLYPQTPGSRFVTYDSQRYGRSIIAHLHMGRVGPLQLYNNII
jgi:hypothetical protein